VAQGKPGAGTHQAIDNSNVGERLTDHRILFAFRPYEKGFVAVSAVHAYYTLTHAFYAGTSIGENGTGLIDGIALRGEKNGRPGDLGRLLDQTYRFFGANASKHGLGAGTVELPPSKSEPPPTAAIDWRTVRPLPSWQHRAIRWPNGSGTEGPDPASQGPVQYFKVLVGPRTALSSGTGTVAEYRRAAQQAGYSAIAFCETFEDIDRARWNDYVQQCENNSDDTFVCLPGLDIKDFQGGRYLLISVKRFPDPGWLTKDGKRMVATRMFSLGWFGHICSVHRTNTGALDPRMYKQFQAFTVYTYDGKGKLIDDSLHAYQWQVRSDSNPIPIAAHELTSPEQVAAAATSGYQQIMPGETLGRAVHYFRFAFPHYFETPVRYFLSEGPILDVWTVLNKGFGPPELNMDRFRVDVGLRSDQPLAEVTLYDGFNVVGRWYPKDKEFRLPVDGVHDAQHEFTLLARDSQGRRVLSPGIRTVPRNWRLRCGDRQNWLGSVFIYTGWNLNGLPGFDVPLVHGSAEVAPIFDYPFFSNHVQIADADLSAQYVNIENIEVGGDGKPTCAVRLADFVEGRLRTVYFSPPKKPELSVMFEDVAFTLKRDVEPRVTSSVWPALGAIRDLGNLLLLPDKAPDQLAVTFDPKTYKTGAGNPNNKAIDLPVGSYAGGLVPLTPGLRLDGRTIGFAAPPASSFNVAQGTTWHARFLLFRAAPFHWRYMSQTAPADAVAEKAMTQMGFRGKTPYRFELTQGRLDRLAYIADMTAASGGVAGTCRNPASEELLCDVPLRIQGLNPRCPAALWRSDQARLEYFGCFQQQGYVTFNADKTVEFYAGNVAVCDPALFVSVVYWDGKEAWFRVNNPLKTDVTTAFATVPAIRGFKPVRKTITVPAGTSVDVREPAGACQSVASP
jgi:hypothetical protein